MAEQRVLSEENIVQEIFYKYLLQYQFDEKNLDYTLLDKHKRSLQTLADIGSSGISVFDLSQRQIVFYSSNYGALLGYAPEDYEKIGEQFFDQKIHPEDKLQLCLNGISILKLFDSFTADEKLNHKLVNEYRIRNAEDRYVRLIEQHQMLELDKNGQIWLMISMVDLSPNQEEYQGIKSQLLNFRTGAIIPMKPAEKAQLELTKREREILKLVKDGLLSKEISSRLSISVHTVNTHRQRFLEKLGANNSMEAVMFASKFGMLE